MLELRDYQRDALNGLYDFWAKGGQNPLLDIPTGAGKSLIQAKLMQEVIELDPTARIVSVTHVRELISQNYEELMDIWPWAPAGIYSAGLNQRNTWSQILFCGIQSVYKRVSEFGAIDLCMVDESHLIPRKSSTMYRKFLQGLREQNPKCKIVGLTATPFRLDSGRLDTGDDAIFSGIAYSVGVKRLIDAGYLVPPIPKGMATKLDISNVHKRGGEFIAGELQAAVDKEAITEAACDEIVEYGRDRKGWIIFATGIDHAEHVMAALCRRGFPCEIITGKMKRHERDIIIEKFKAGELRALSSVGVLTTGFNARHVDLLAFLRPTMSVGLYIQMVGRGMRTFPEKTDCLVLDFAGNVLRHGPIDDPMIREPGEGGGPAPMRECPNCHTISFASYRACPTCGFVFEIEQKPKINATAANLPLLSDQNRPQWTDVDDWRFFRHQKFGKPATLRVEYICGMITHREWVCFEHEVGSFPRKKAVEWWQGMGGETPAPYSIEEVLHRGFELSMPSQILVRPEGRFFSITGHLHALQNLKANAF